MQSTYAKHICEATLCIAQHMLTARSTVPLQDTAVTQQDKSDVLVCGKCQVRFLAYLLWWMALWEATTVQYCK